jgi:hypothetical protein
MLMSDPCIYIFEADGVFAMIALYVDDVHVACNNTAWRVAFTALVRSRFDIKDQGDLSDIIGMHITRDRATRTISLDHGKYVREPLDKHDMVDCKPSCMPMDPGFLASISKHIHVPLTGTGRDIYPSLLDSLQYAAVCTRPDISTALSILGSAEANPTVVHMQTLRKVLRYLKGSPSMSLTWGGADSSLQLTCLADADWGNDSETRRSRSRFMFKLGRGAVSYKSRKLSCVAQSSCEAEYYSAADATKEAIHIRQMLSEIFSQPVSGTTTILEDNQSCIAYLQNALLSEKTKHIDMKSHFVKDHVQLGTFKLQYLLTRDMVADMLTKPLPRHALVKHKSAIMGTSGPM